MWFQPGAGLAVNQNSMAKGYLHFLTKKDFISLRTGIGRVVRVIEETGRQVENGVHESYANMEYPASEGGCA